MANKMWGGRFSNSPDKIMEIINSSIHFDIRLALQDIQGSIAHAKMLGEVSIITKEESEKIITGLKEIKKEIENGNFKTSVELEDIHMNIENRLNELIGDLSGKLHTGRSRNDQVATDIKLYLREKINYIVELINTYQKTLSLNALKYYDTIMPGFTHLQSAQPITFGHHLLAYVELAERDKGRFTDCLQRLDECPLGAAALAGTSYPIDRFMTASILGFKKPMANSLDAVSSRDLLLETLSVIAITAINLSRFAEELVLWSSTEFNYIKLSDKYTSGSSIMPQKRNPDAAELVRAKSGRTIGSLITLFTVLKGLPLAYSKDMQEDKEALFDSIDTIEISLLALIGMVEDMKPNIKKMHSASKEGFSIATDIADMLVIKIGIPFREAHNIVGKMVALAEKNNTYLDKLDPEEIITIDKRIPHDIMNLITLDNMVLNKTSYGGTSPHEVLKRANEWVKRLS